VVRSCPPWSQVAHELPSPSPFPPHSLLIPSPFLPRSYFLTPWGFPKSLGRLTKMTSQSRLYMVRNSYIEHKQEKDMWMLLKSSSASWIFISNFKLIGGIAERLHLFFLIGKSFLKLFGGYPIPSGKCSTWSEGIGKPWRNICYFQKWPTPSEKFEGGLPISSDAL
jgi:hypothetical protein